MLPIMENEFVQRRKWISSEQMLDVYSLTNSLPGVIALNSSLMIGRMIAGTPGALFSVLGVLTPSVVIIIALASLMDLLSAFMPLQWAFSGVRAGVTAILLIMVFKMGKKIFTSWKEVLLALAAFLLVALFEVNAVLVILFCAFAGFFLFKGEGR